MGLPKLKRLPMLLPTLFSIMVATPILSGCSHVQVKDEILYFDEGPSGAHSVHFLTSSTGDIDKQIWDSMREGMVCMSPEAFADFKAEFEKFCTLVNCDYRTLQMMDAFFARVENARDMLK